MSQDPRIMDMRSSMSFSSLQTDVPHPPRKCDSAPSLIDAAWPNGTSSVRYQPDEWTAVKTLEIHASECKGDLKVDFIERCPDEQPGVLHRQKDPVRSWLSIVVITQSCKLGNTGYEKLRQFDISKQAFTHALDRQGLTSFFNQTRRDITGLFGLAKSQEPRTDLQDDVFFAFIFDAVLGIWARYDPRCKRWQGVWIVNDTSLSLAAIAEELKDFGHIESFLHLFVAKYTVEFLWLRAGDLSRQIREIELHSGHHDSILRVIPATYEMLEKLSAKATAQANLASYYKEVTSQLANELLQHIERQCGEDSQYAKDAMPHVIGLRQRLGSLGPFLSYLERRAERQITAILHLVNQANASTSLAVANDTQILARASKRDASSMKVLAAVTTVFLPGAFVATLFSMNMFDWFAKDGEVVISGRFWIYWALTVPLTFLTVGFWAGFEFWTLNKQHELH